MRRCRGSLRGFISQVQPPPCVYVQNQGLSDGHGSSSGGLRLRARLTQRGVEEFSRQAESRF